MSAPKRHHIDPSDVVRRATAELESHPNLQRHRPAAVAAVPDIELGRPFRVRARDLPRLGGAAWTALVDAARKELGIDADQLAWAFEVTANRLSGTNPTSHQVLGTFIEVIASVSPAVVETRNGLTRVCLAHQVRAILLGDAAFFTQEGARQSIASSASGDSGFALTLADLGLDLDSDQLKTARQNLGDVFHGAHAGVAREAAIDAAVAQITDLLEARVIHARDTVIGTEEFVDRAVFLPLTNGRVLLVLSEEYKAVRSQGGGAQSAMRLYRLFNNEVGAQTPFGFTRVSKLPLAEQALETAVEHKAQWITMDKLVVSNVTRGTDQMLVKESLSGRNDLKLQFQNLNRKIAEARTRRGDPVRASRKLEISFFKQYVSLPGREVRELFAVIRTNPPTR